MCGAICICLCTGSVIFSIAGVGIYLKLFSLFGDFGFYYVLEIVLYYSILSLKIFVTLVGVCILLQMLFNLAKDILELKKSNKYQKDINIVKENLFRILKIIIFNIIGLFILYECYITFQSEFYKTIIILYTCIILGFTASFPISEGSYTINTNTQGLLLLKTFGNFCLLFSSYSFYHFYLKHKL